MNAPTPSPPPTVAVPPKPVVAWSFSALEMFENCAYKYWAVKIKKSVSDINKWNAAGDREHDNFKLYLQKGLMLPAELMGFLPLLDRIKSAPGELIVEQKLTLDLHFNPCRGDDWNRAWVRGAADCVNIDPTGTKATYLDWKSGKYKENDDQIELSSLLLFRHYPSLQVIKGGLVFYKHNRMYPHIVHRDKEQLLWNGFISRVNELEMAIKTDHFPKTQNGLCAYCPVKDCQYNTVEQRLAREAERAAATQGR